MRIPGLAACVLPLLLCVGCATAPDAGDPALDDADFLLPGSFSEQTTLADLQARFGAANVRVVEPTGEGERSIVLFESDPTRRAFLEFHDDKTLSGLRSIAVRDAGSRWRGKQGVHVGMRLSALQAANGKPFGYSGFDGEGRGWVHDQWSLALDDDDATLGRLDVSAGEQMYFNVELVLRAEGAGLPADAYPRDDILRSDDPRYPRLGDLVEVAGFSASTSLDDEW